MHVSKTAEGNCRVHLMEDGDITSLDQLFEALDGCKAVEILITEVVDLGYSGNQIYALIRAEATRKGLRVDVIR